MYLSKMAYSNIYRDFIKHLMHLMQGRLKIIGSQNVAPPPPTFLAQHLGSRPPPLALRRL